MTAYYVAVDGEQKGPFTLAEVRAQCSQGIIQAQTLMWRDGLNEWLAAALVLQGTGVTFSGDARSSPISDHDDHPYTVPFDASLRFEVPAASLAAGRGVEWLKDGWALFKASPGMWIVALLIWVGVQFVLGFVPVLGSFVGVLLGPSFAVGVMAFAHGLASNGNAEIGTLFIGFREKLGSLVVLGLVYFVMMLAVIIVGGLLIFAVLGGTAIGHSTNPQQIVASMFSGGALPFLLVLTVVASMIVLVVAAYLYAPALVFFTNQTAVDALKQSFGACLRNWLPLTVFGLLSIPIFLVGVLPFGLGLLIVIPVLFAANYASFRDMFGREGE